MTNLNAELRDGSQSNSDLRAKGKIAAVFYGKKRVSTLIAVLLKDVIKVWKDAGESGVISIKTPKQTVDALIHEIDIDPVTDIPRHADFYVFEKGKKIEVDVPLEFVGIAPAVKDLGGTLVKTLHEIKVSADPQHIPREIQVDISSLVDFSSQILAEQIVLPTGVNLVELPHEVVASVSAPREDEPEETTPVDLSSIEVEKKGKKDEEGAEGASAEA